MRPEALTAAAKGGGRHARPSSHPPSRRAGWLGLAAGVAALVLLLGAAPYLHAPLGIEDGVARLQAQDIDAGATYYNMVEQVPAAEAMMRAGMRTAAPEEPRP